LYTAIRKERNGDTIQPSEAIVRITRSWHSRAIRSNSAQVNSVLAGNRPKLWIPDEEMATAWRDVLTAIERVEP
jgi:hypothetical protein